MIDVVTKNCLLNFFTKEDLKKALAEIYRILNSLGRLVLGHPIPENQIPVALKNDYRLGALYLSDSLPLAEYLKMIADVGFGIVTIRTKRPYRILALGQYDKSENILLESV